RAATRVITGGDEQDQRREDDFVRHDDRDGRTREALALAGRYGRTMRYSISVRPITAPAESRARERAAWIADVATRRIGEARQARTTGSVTGGLGGYGATTSAIERDAAVTTSTGRRRLIGLAASGEVHDERLWTRIAGLTGGAGNSTALVGTPDQVAEAMLRYCDLGVTTLLLRGFDPVADAVAFGEELLPRLRAGTRRRSSSRPDVSVGS
ncbi:MAG: LLM class flavin-dependent oxidoreductase, partial [Actinomycetota bacterium]|nr:LLM class flavin-dependent oxidoreductase [Actinomycetota bacterium]